MRMNQARFWLLGIFIAFLSVQMGAFFIIGQKMWPEDLQRLIVKLLAIYSVHLAIIFGAIFAEPKVTRGVSKGLAITAMVLAGLWNLLLVWRSLAFSFAREGSVTDLISYLDTVSGAASFLVAGVLARCCHPLLEENAAFLQLGVEEVCEANRGEGTVRVLTPRWFRAATIAHRLQ